MRKVKSPWRFCVCIWNYSSHKPLFAGPDPKESIQQPTPNARILYVVRPISLSRIEPRLSPHSFFPACTPSPLQNMFKTRRLSPAQKTQADFTPPSAHHPLRDSDFALEPFVLQRLYSLLSPGPPLSEAGAGQRRNQQRWSGRVILYCALRRWRLWLLVGSGIRLVRSPVFSGNIPRIWEGRSIGQFFGLWMLWRSWSVILVK